MQVEKVKDRKPPEGKSQTNAQKIISWVEAKESGTVFKMKEMLSDTEISDNALKDLKKNNKFIKQYLENMKTDKRGYYKVG